MTTVAEVIVQTLKAAGVRRCYGIPRHTLNHITDAIRTIDIRWVHVRHEEAGEFAAGADEVLTGERAAWAGSCGPGSLHFINGLLESHRNRAPAILIANQIVRDELGFDFKGGAIHPQYLTETISRHEAPDAVFTADGGSPMVWCLRHIASTSTNRTVVSLSHGTMASAMPQVLGAAAALPDRQVIALSGDGGIAMLLGDLSTAVQEKLTIKVVVYNNGALDFAEIEQKVEGLLDAYTDLVNPDFARVAEAIGVRGWRVEKAEDLDAAVQTWLAEPGPTMLDVVTDRFELVMPPNVKAGRVAGMAFYSAKAVLSGRGRDVVGMVGNLLS